MERFYSQIQAVSAYSLAQIANREDVERRGLATSELGVVLGVSTSVVEGSSGCFLFLLKN
ncbi:hypothetical protein ES288_A13G181200v1 [Gossypium darwinii]|uniref:Uncharacterized protein n=1 Tax=Gossypium darwinii TaxID=34276 RepID=A0A5D2E101_GOSDA|nr:hypothetical protein ES288_A13G181200v1 [Gossypium darwinii]